MKQQHIQQYTTTQHTTPHHTTPHHTTPHHTTPHHTTPQQLHRSFAKKVVPIGFLLLFIDCWCLVERSRKRTSNHFSFNVNRTMDSVPAPIANKSRAEQWMSNFLAIEKFYHEHGHLTIRNKTLSQWLTYQRLHAKTLNEKQVTLLESIKYKDQNSAGVHERNEDIWKRKYKALEKFVSQHGGDIRGLPPHLRSWVYRQRCKFNDRSLGPQKQTLFQAIGVDLSIHSKGRSNSGSKKKSENEFWHQKYRDLQQYQRKYGHCNVPYRFHDDRSLGMWVSNQRKRYRRMTAKGKENGAMWIKLLEDINFEWTRKPPKSQLRNCSSHNRIDKQNISKDNRFQKGCCHHA